ncbi:hypothetical protein GCM10009596_17100 [Arthrobacter rhombi]|uniref:DUF2975 domain-containing protein n=1 Tax=Arthrobacter rhombi TaxID=71253 RepID=UPI0031DEE0B8
MNVEQIPVLRVAVVTVAVGAILTQALITPAVANSFAGAYPEAAYLATPYMIAIIVAIFGLEAALLAIWRLISIAKPGNHSHSVSTNWINFMTLCLIFAAVIMAFVFTHAAFIAYVGGPPVLFGLLASIALAVSAPFFRNVMKRSFIEELSEKRPDGSVEESTKLKART